MGIDTSMIGRTRPGGTLLVTRSRLRHFAKATGQTDPLFVDVETARRQGHRDLPVPPTFYFAVDFEMPDPFAYLTEAGVDLRAVLHAEQRFVYHRTAYAGDELTSSSVVTDVFEKKGGELRFLVSQTPVVDVVGHTVVVMHHTVAVRTLPGAAA
ncbi:MaoC family dehydratase N-terminal domain-containing protein [Nocardioides sp. LHD-245]|uniref:MaoC family dehydratase N-terminal domain-containing protein n=1 Tax=Nocardioides sp. LHD-245 TaxID=3051387 RepID=UPI0027E1F877|nr:MaoC family dehydratase N-terminal domain-containing protein [Nocardioides sp. LHD-245]